MSYLQIKKLRVYFKSTGIASKTNEIRAVDGVSFTLEKGESIGLVGESGCGKTTLGNSIICLVPSLSGRIIFEGNEVRCLKGKSLKTFRQKVQMIFQDPFASLNPRMPIGASISEGLKIHNITTTRKELNLRVAELLKDVGLEPEYANRYPHELSGGQRQRIGIARALALRPSLIIADEPVSALDVSVQVQILNLMKDLKKKMNLSYIFIAHDLAVVKYMCDKILVMYLGKIVESATVSELFSSPAHPYTEALLSAVPDVDKGLKSRKKKSHRIVLKGDVPSADEFIPGCPFHQRCHRVRDICRNVFPVQKKITPSHVSMCHFAEEMISQ